MAFKSYKGLGSGFLSEDDERRFQALRRGASQTSQLGGGEYFADDTYEYKTVAGLNPNHPEWGNRVEPGYELAGYLSGGGNFFNPRTRDVWGLIAGVPMSGSDTPVGVIKRKKAPPAQPPASAEAPPPAAPTPTPPAPMVEARNPSLADALKEQGERQQRPALQDALNSALRLGGQQEREPAAPQTTAEAGAQQDSGEEERSDRRFAASERWRKRLAEATGRLSQPGA